MGAGNRKQLGVESAVAESAMLFHPVVLLLQIIPAIAFLSPRQSDPGIGDVPAACAGNCTGLAVVENCLSTKNETCLCNQPLESAVFGCFLCLGNLTGNFSIGQEVINELASACDPLGLTLSPLTFPGQTFSVSQTPTAPVGPPPTSAPSNGLTGITTGSNGFGSSQTTMTLQGSSSQPTGSPSPTSGARTRTSSDRITAILWIIVPTLLTLSLSIVQ